MNRFPIISDIVNNINNKSHRNSINFFRSIIDAYSKNEYIDFLDSFNNDKSNFTHMCYSKNGYSTYKLYSNNKYTINMIEWQKDSKGPIIYNNNSVIKLLEGTMIEDRYLDNMKFITSNCLVPIHSFNLYQTHSYYFDHVYSLRNTYNAKSYSLHFDSLNK